MDPSPLFIERLRRFAPLALVLASVIAAATAYLQALDYPFVSDDKLYLTDNIKLAGLHLSGLWRIFTEPYTSFSEFLPLRDFSYWIDIKLFGLNPSALRMHNILLHLLCLPLAYAATAELWRYFRPADAAGAPWAAAAVTALFALHPTLVEPVVWISGRKYVLPNLFSMLALWLAVRARREKGLSAPHAAAAMVAFAAVMLSKASYVAVAPVIALLWMAFWLDTSAQHRHRFQLLWPLAILLLAGLLFRIFIAASGGTGDTGVMGVTGVPVYFGTEAATRTLAVLGWLARLAVSPENRHFYYMVLEDPYLPAMVVLGMSILAAAMACGVMLLRKRSLEYFTLVVFLLFCMPYMQLVSYASPTLVSDRYLALAAWPAILLLVALVWRLKPLPRTAMLLLIALSWGLQTVERVRDWRSFEAIIDADLRAYPGYYLPATIKINDYQLPQRLYRDAGETANNINSPELRNVLLKLVYTDNAVHIKSVSTGNPHEAAALLQNLGSILKQPPDLVNWNPSMRHVWGHYQQRLKLLWDHLARQFPDDASVRYNAGLWMLDMHEYKHAISHLRSAAGSQSLPEPLRGAAFYKLGLALMSYGQPVEAETALRAALLQESPDRRAYCLLSEIYKQSGRLEEAARAEATCPSPVPDEETIQQ